jgi:hypothetical protein
MDQEPETTPLRRLGRKREIHRLSIWELLDAEWNAGLMQWANDVKQRLIAAKRQELNLERQNLALSGGYLWPDSLNTGPPYLPSPPAALEPHVSDREIESLALRLATQSAPWDPAGDRHPPTVEDLVDRLPPYAAAEVRRRAEELRRLLP